MRYATDGLNASPHWRGQIYQLPADESERISQMSNALWCDIDDAKTNAVGQIGHSFSDKDPERQHFTKSQFVNVPTGNSYGTPTYQERREIAETLDICGYHWRKQNPFSQEKPAKELASQPTLSDMEEENDAWQRGYQAGEDHANYTANRG